VHGPASSAAELERIARAVLDRGNRQTAVRARALDRRVDTLGTPGTLVT
jgi:hypothetical protein